MANSKGAYQKKQTNLANVKARHLLLLECLENPSKVTPLIAQSLQGQRAFAALTLEGTEIKGISLNTLKSLSDEALSKEAGEQESGFKFLDAQRAKLHSLIAETSPKKTQPAGETLSQAVKILESRLRGVESQNILRLKAYFDLYGKLDNLVRSGSSDEAIASSIRNILTDHQKIFGALNCPSPDLSDQMNNGTVSSLNPR
ncbi:hypothetical protein SAMN05446635_8427 [Burkholderia sp. OK233]|nr:hypothetical protein SAMN05446635_8427 [Burkholderia sp. OK233]